MEDKSFFQVIYLFIFFSSNKKLEKNLYIFIYFCIIEVLVYPLWNSIGIIFPNLKIFSDNILENCKILAAK
jgi:hypothetical protein